MTDGAAPKGDWAPALSKALISDWCFDCRGGTTVIEAETSEGKKITVYLKLEAINGESN